MFKSFWFWLLLILGIFVMWMARDQIAAFFSGLSIDQPQRTTNTQELVTTLTPVGDIGISTSGNGSTAPAPPAPPDSSKFTVYVVQSGDTLYSIATAHNTTVNDLIDVNNIWDPTSLSVGQELKIAVPATPTPQKTATLAPTVKATPTLRADVYIVQPGDTLSSIARQSGISAAELQTLNNLDNPNQLAVGDRLLVPTPSAKPTAASATDATLPPPTPDGGAPAADTPQPVQTQPTSAVGTPAAGAAEAPASVPSPTIILTPPPLATVTPTPAPAPKCPTGQTQAFVWGLSLCIPDGWTLQERGEPHRAVFMTHEETGGERSVIAIIRPKAMEGATQAWIMRTAQRDAPDELGGQIPGGVGQIVWNQAEGVSAGGYSGLAANGSFAYSTGTEGRARLTVFNDASGQRWLVLMAAPKERWGYYSEVVFPAVMDSLSVF